MPVAFRSLMFAILSLAALPACSSHEPCGGPCGSNQYCNTMGGPHIGNCMCVDGYYEESSRCVDFDECFYRRYNCKPDQMCRNTVGSYECVACGPPRVMCNGKCTNFNYDDNNCGACGHDCGPLATCRETTCTQIRELLVSATWSRDGVTYLVLQTPNGKLISPSNKGPSADTDYGSYDEPINAPTGPEAIEWSSGPPPPSGTYHVCFENPGLTPPISSTNPLNFTVSVARPNQSSLVFTGSRTRDVAAQDHCQPGDISYVGSFTYP